MVIAVHFSVCLISLEKAFILPTRLAEATASRKAVFFDKSDIEAFSKGSYGGLVRLSKTICKSHSGFLWSEGEQDFLKLLMILDRTLQSLRSLLSSLKISFRAAL